MDAEYPNLDYFERIFRDNIIGNKSMIRENVDAYVFPQIWPNTGGGFAEPGYMYGQAMTKQYTTVMFNSLHDKAMVCFGDKPAYVVEDPTDAFWEDFNNHFLKTKHDAKGVY